MNKNSLSNKPKRLQNHKPHAKFLFQYELEKFFKKFLNFCI